MRSTYRVQLRPGFGFAEAAAIVDYLSDLGVGAFYTSPILTPTPGSTHGYDVVDPTRANPELGGEAGRRALVDRLRAAGLDLVVDVVPNHMAVEVPSANKWWWDVLAHGPESRYAGYFDIESFPVLLPVLGSDEDVSELRVDGDVLRYYDHTFPIAPGTGEGDAAEVHDRQHYRLIDWRRAGQELNYRRFFDVTTLAGVRVEVPEVFDATHGEVLRWVSEGDVQGLRIDHPDGLADPGGYVRRLAERARCWIVVEKILEPGEDLPASWPVAGTTGYDALREVCGVFVDQSAEDAFTKLADSLEVPTDYAAVLDESRRLITSQSLAAEVRRIASHVSDVDPAVAREAVAELMVSFPVYRSYLPEGVEYLTAALARARSQRPDLGEALAAIDTQLRARGELATRLQQTSGMVVAKGTEDTAFYRYTRFAALNEVGGDPSHFGVSVAEFHTAQAHREANHPLAMTALSTHDTKRSEDVRARMAVLAELPDEFGDAVRRWTAQRGIPEPSLNLLAWQTLLGAWPINPDRLSAYLDKAAKESKIRTSWTEHDEEFEETVRAWPRAVLGDPGLLAEVKAFAARITPFGWSNSLGQKLLQLAGPGIPDVYQGTELWDLSLVDPDNRRPVDFADRADLVSKLATGWPPPIDETGAVKLHLVRTVLRLRRERPSLFTGYAPVYASGSAAHHVVAFERSGLIAVATRLPVALPGWGDTVLDLPDGEWVDQLTGRATDGRLADTLADYPVALLVRGA
ncbi:malto-oligosyltrehalose synthase [Actinokineospora globicatena]|uniref:malto-oligosyltrehalose synthase n=1 Tax=Actinokineospora globicatena TaxID=103729 RepID=UPI0020A42554|nr:malto-oligosyltrehalose synthase [Actinokineospora globicatena]MCP2302239.1 (1->4)-alpha-D-glucan 1-alpha-D-glucosylmutase [Actinokineospora globicatena]GLW76097.1 malto-oligosyltrehalose synthase [Actinokineospora globicatena]GLW82932.1 malto-oligosyltrehalose synthase [Actinokineospora globicatena]